MSSDAFADEKIRTMRAFGAEVELIPSPDGITPDLIPSMMRRAAEITAQTGAFATDQFNNADMVEGYRRLGEELLDQRPGPPRISALCSYVGTAGCFLGVSRALAAALPRLHRAVVEPAESAVLSGRPPGTHHIEGGGTGQRPPQLWPADYDEVIAIPEAKAFAMARQAAREEGIFSGPSTGPNLAAALADRPAARTRPPGGHPPGRQRPEIPHRPALLLTRPTCPPLRQRTRDPGISARVMRMNAGAVLAACRRPASATPVPGDPRTYLNAAEECAASSGLEGSM